MFSNKVGEKDIDLMCVHLNKWVNKGILYRVYEKGQAWYAVPKIMEENMVKIPAGSKLKLEALVDCLSMHHPCQR